MRESESEKGGERAREGKQVSFYPWPSFPAESEGKCHDPAPALKLPLLVHPDPLYGPVVATSDAVLVGHSLHRH